MFLKEDELCPACRRGLTVKRRMIDLGMFRVESFFEYDGLFRTLLLQYKECHDEALKDVFLYDLSDYISLKYRNYRLLTVPSSERKKRERGFDHLEEMFRSVRLERASGLRMKEQLCQEGMDLEQRKRMSENYVYEGEHLSKVLIVDDVITTGSSLMGVFRAVGPHAEKVKVLSLAYKSITLHY